ncbi:MAG TPA: hypothetical protein VG815_18950, partial [Chloroflexota bacterium]|nr:hypothetical protein [Chloroflexota bacterium]
MNWPTPQDYNEAVQNPNVNFRDPELRAARASLTPSGLPLPITGNFASVYRMSIGARPLAVRCFFREFADMQARYAAISRHLQAARPGYTTGFSYLNDGIAIRGKPFPVLKMDWVEGVLLDDYVRKHLADRKALANLAEGWMRMAATLRAHGVAHGDLQHGNVLVRNGALCLVDYDGMFVPALAGKSSCELGHPNYQHPARDAALFGAHMDNFSHWLMYLSLAAVAEDPDLW